MSDIFVSYASEDRERILPLVRALETTGWSVFWDRTIPAGKTWRQVIGGEIEACRCLVVAWSQTSVGKDWVHEEADVGKRRGILIPVLLDGVEPPFGFGSIQAANLVGWDGAVASAPFVRLLDDIAQILGPVPRQGTGSSAPTDDKPRQAHSEAGMSPKITGTEQVEASVPAQVAREERGPPEAPSSVSRNQKSGGARSYLIGGVVAVVLLGGLAIALWPAGKEGREAPMFEPRPPDRAVIEPEPEPTESEARAREEAERAAAEAAQRELEQRIAELMDLAESAEQAQRLTTPSGDNAVAYYREVLGLDPRNAGAEEGLRRVVAQYLQWAEQSLARRRLDRVERHLDKAASIDPDHPMIAELRRELDVARAAKEAAVREPPRPAQPLAVDVPAAPEPSEVAARVPGDVFRDPMKSGGEGPEMIVLPAGEFRMGDIQGDGDPDERPVHRVELRRAFAIARYETTFEDYDRFASATGRALPGDEGWGRGRRPVIQVSWVDAAAYAEWLSAQTGHPYRLPSEAEWEYAARAGTESRFWWGAEPRPGMANCRGCGGEWDGRQTAPIGQFSPNPFGLHDTAGNVWEWVQDCWQGNHQGAPSDGSSREGGSCERRVVRGGGWNLQPQDLRSSYRTGYGAARRFYDFGFRLVRELE